MQDHGEILSKAVTRLISLGFIGLLWLLCGQQIGASRIKAGEQRGGDWTNPVRREDSSVQSTAQWDTNRGCLSQLGRLQQLTRRPGGLHFSVLEAGRVMRGQHAHLC